nr:FprA family A-type flavoprotein [Methanobrevibacter sp.]
VLDSKAICLGAPTIMNKAYPSVGDIIYYLDALNFKATGYTKKAVVFGSKGWGGGANKKMSAELEAAGFDVVDQFDTIFIPDDDVLDQCYDLGKKLAQSLKDE